MVNRDIYRIIGFPANRVSTLIILFFLLLPQFCFAVEDEKYEGVLIINSGSELWRDIRQRENSLEGPRLQA